METDGKNKKYTEKEETENKNEQEKELGKEKVVREVKECKRDEQSMEKERAGQNKVVKSTKCHFINADEVGSMESVENPERRNKNDFTTQCTTNCLPSILDTSTIPEPEN